MAKTLPLSTHGQHEPPPAAPVAGVRSRVRLQLAVRHISGGYQQRRQLAGVVRVDLQVTEPDDSVADLDLLHLDRCLLYTSELPTNREV